MWRNLALSLSLKIKMVWPSQWNHTGLGWGVWLESTVVSQMIFSEVRRRLIRRPSREVKSTMGPPFPLPVQRPSHEDAARSRQYDDDQEQTEDPEAVLIVQHVNSEDRQRRTFAEAKNDFLHVIHRERPQERAPRRGESDDHEIDEELRLLRKRQLARLDEAVLMGDESATEARQESAEPESPQPCREDGDPEGFRDRLVVADGEELEPDPRAEKPEDQRKRDDRERDRPPDGRADRNASVALRPSQGRDVLDGERDRLPDRDRHGSEQDPRGPLEHERDGEPEQAAGRCAGKQCDEERQVPVDGRDARRVPADAHQCRVRDRELAGRDCHV